MRLWLRELRAKPLLAFLTVSLGVSLAAGVTALALYGAVQWRALPFDEPDGLLSLEVYTAAGERRWWSGPDLRALSEALPPGIERVAGFTVADYNVLAEHGRSPEALLGTLVSQDFFQVLGIGVQLGRPPSPDELADGGPHVVVLGHGLWQRRYGGDPAIIGRTVRLAAPEYLGEPETDYRVIGVLRPEAWLFWKRADLVLPLRAGNHALAKGDAYLVERVIARSAVDAHPTPALAAAILERLPPSRERAARVMVAPLAAALFRDLRPQLLLVLVVACLVLGLAIINMIIAVAADTLSRRQQDAIRLALGATAFRMTRDAATRISLTAAVAGLLSVIVTAWQLGAVTAVVPDGWLARVPGEGSGVRVSGPVLMGLAATLTVLVVGVSAWTCWMAYRLSRGSVIMALQPLDVPTHHRWRGLLVGIEVALCTAVVIIATSLTLQLHTARRTDFGVDADRTMAAWINASATTYADARSRARYFERIVDRIAGTPGIEAVGAISLPFHFTWQTVPVRPEAAQDIAAVHALDRNASPTYADVAGLRVLDGRWFGPSDDSGAPAVVVVSAALAHALWPAQRAVGQTMIVGEGANATYGMVIGVASDTRPAAHMEPSRTVYRPMAQVPPPWIYVTVRTAPGTAVWRALTAAVWDIDPNQPIDGPWSLQTWIADRTAELSFVATTAVALAAIAVLLVGTGLLGLTMHWVYASRREISIRRALGASDGAILWWFGRRWLGVVSPAIVVGTALQMPMLRAAVAVVEGLRDARAAEVVCGALAVMAFASVGAVWGLTQVRRIEPRELAR